MQKDKPARVSDDDPRCDISGAQKFDGEDLNSKARQKLMQEQMREEWTRRQAAEKKRQRDLQSAREADCLDELRRRQAYCRAMDLAQMELELRQALNEAMRDYNESLADEQAEKARLAQQQELDNFTEMVNHVYGDMLQSEFGPHHDMTASWPSLPPEQLVAEIRRIQEWRRQEMKCIKEDEEEREKEWGRH